MKEKRFSVEQIMAVLKQAELGLPWRLVRRSGVEQRFTAGNSETCSG